MATLMGGNRSSGNAVGGINRLTQVHRPICWIEMVGELTAHTRHLHVTTTILLQHRISDVTSCHGNTQGLSALCAGMRKDEVIARLEGINCKNRGTSCPDQLASALKKM